MSNDRTAATVDDRREMPGVAFEPAVAAGCGALGVASLAALPFAGDYRVAAPLLAVAVRGVGGVPVVRLRNAATALECGNSLGPSPTSRTRRGLRAFRTTPGPALGTRATSAPVDADGSCGAAAGTPGVSDREAGPGNRAPSGEPAATQTACGARDADRGVGSEREADRGAGNQPSRGRSRGRSVRPGRGELGN